MTFSDNILNTWNVSDTILLLVRSNNLAKVRLALIAAAAGRNFDSHTLLKECLKADESNIALRSVYTHFLTTIGSHKEALAFTTQTLKYDRADPSTFCALGWLHFSLGREAKSSQEIAGRTKEYLRSAEAYQRALDLDPTSAVAAQGLAIALAEDTLSLVTGNPGSVDEAKTRQRLAGQALGVFSRIADSLPSGAVNVNMGHCYFARGEEEKAIQAVSCNRSSKLNLTDEKVRICIEQLQRPKSLSILVPRQSLVRLCQPGIKLFGHVKGFELLPTSGSIARGRQNSRIGNAHPTQRSSNPLQHRHDLAKRCRIALGHGSQQAYP